ncbi:MAG: uroporphyrinogen-III C-methyltransferase [Prevotellaceae bacterium]|jgi:uroporphyrinogen III methyltransferase/synthase|nr:uroporphyrinogen-III C-methyltransferase [Prevotellaceae bacterium]
MSGAPQFELKAVARDSRLSLLQVEEFFSHFPDVRYSLSALKSYGDKNKHISLMDNVAGDFFTRELDAAILSGAADVAVHSAKDLPYPLPAGVALYCLTAADDKTDALVSRGGLRLEELPQAAKVGTSSRKRRDELLALRPDLTVVSIRGTIEERILQVDEGKIDALIAAACALKRLGMGSRIAQVLPFETHPLQGSLAVTGKKDNPALQGIFSKRDVRNTYGKVTLVGFGPGNPDLLTIGGDKALCRADVIFHDDLVDKDFLNKYRAVKVYAGKRSGRHSFGQDEINELVYQAAISGKNVVRLKGGDPMVFAHGREEIDYLQSRFVSVEVIPGISAGIALSSSTHIPLTHRGVASSVAFVTGHSVKEEASAPNADTLVYYMGGANISGIAKALMLSGRSASTPVALVHNVSLPGQKIFFTTLEELQFSVIKYPTPIAIVVGEVVLFESGAARPPGALLTGTALPEYPAKGTVVHTPLITVEKNDDKNLLRMLKSSLDSLQWIVFSSRHGVRYFFEMMKELALDVRCLGSVKVASVGKVTSAELCKHDIYPEAESATESAEGLVQYFREIKLTGSNVLLPRSDKGLQYLSDELTRLGNRVVDLPVYVNRVNRDAKKVNLAEFQKIVFSSPSGIDAFKQIYGELPEGIQLVAKGKTTENKIKLELNETF